jgi:hypothetical protein
VIETRTWSVSTGCANHTALVSWSSPVTEAWRAQPPPLQVSTVKSTG